MYASHTCVESSFTFLAQKDLLNLIKVDVIGLQQRFVHSQSVEPRIRIQYC